MVGGAVHRAARAAIERLYDGRCTAIVRKGSVNPVTKRTEFGESELYIDQPCRLSFGRSKNITGDGAVASVSQAVSLFIAPELSIPEGTKIIVTQSGVTTAYSNSGTPSIYPTHQEIQLSLFERWASGKKNQD